MVSAIEAVREVTGAPDIDVIGFCAGGILLTLALNQLAALGEAPVHSASYAVTLLDWGGDVPVKAFSASKLLALARWNSARAGVISAKDMGSAFTWMRPDDLVWKAWVNNYLMGDKPPRFDILAWNADGTNLPAALHAQFLDLFEHNLMATPGALTCLGTPVDLGTIKVPTYVTGGVTDHLTPWASCYRTTQLLGGPSTFVLSNAGHIQSLVNPPGNPKATFYTGSSCPPTRRRGWPGRKSTPEPGGPTGGTGSTAELGRDEGRSGPARQRGAPAAGRRAGALRERSSAQTTSGLDHGDHDRRTY